MVGSPKDTVQTDKLASLFPFTLHRKTTCFRLTYKCIAKSLLCVFCLGIVLAQIQRQPNDLLNDEASIEKPIPISDDFPDCVTQKIEKKTQKTIPHLPNVKIPSADPNRTLHWLDLWADDKICNQFDVRLLDENSIQPRALVSFPGSGNTWLRMLLMGLTGYYIGTIYPGDELFRSKAGINYELKKDCNCTLLQKTHDFSLFSILYNMALSNQSTETIINRDVKNFNGNGILVIRNPFKAILSYRNFAFGGMAGMAPSAAFSQDPNDMVVRGHKVYSSWDEFLTRNIATWELLATVWIRNLKRGGIVYYEKLRRDTGVQLKRMTKMLGIDHVNQERLDCILRHNQDNSFKRSQTASNYPEKPFTESQRLLILKSIETVQLLLKEKGYEPLPVELYDFYTPLYEYGQSLQ